MWPGYLGGGRLRTEKDRRGEGLDREGVRVLVTLVFWRSSCFRGQDEHSELAIARYCASD